ncbi:DEAD/DEAH box helicase [Chitinophaga eiseniae]|uniref:ATP-binding domain-containing protein n=1 Tax=Chitinophaga eiseniae TaxID=634771 RepID=A0A847SH88_9BACT|nr:DEAD/DEAH box helicase [Chitinophaga eiseniae]NLR78395.1 ATP-binding domain-containing protein [Chitinophaga eiseniae]
MKQQNILKFWRDIEIFNLPDVKKDFKFISDEDPLSWYNDRAAARQDYTWQHTLLFGYIPKKQVIDCIYERLKTNAPEADYEQPVTGYTCLAALTLDENGCPDQQSYLPAAYIFGLRCLKEKEGLANVKELLNTAMLEFELRYDLPPVSEEPDEDAGGKQKKRKGPQVNWAGIRKEITYLAGLCDWVQGPIKLRIFSQEMHKDAQPDTNFLNSFYLEDLDKLLENPGYFNNSLSQYLQTDIHTGHRQDLINEREYLVNWVHPKLMSPGRWPSPVQYGMYTAQLGAVNSILALQPKEGIQGVNGPPGTGKTTLLKDVVADIIVSRAQKMLSCDVADLFGAYKKITREDGYVWHTYTINPKIAGGTGIVVASNNNSAIENITKELPAATAIDRTVFSAADHFSTVAARLVDTEAWGILSAALGNSENRYKFKQHFWASTEAAAGFEDILWSVYNGGDQTPVYRERYAACRSELRELLTAFEDFQQKSGSFHELLQSYLQALADYNKNEDILEQLEEESKSLEDELAEIDLQYKAVIEDIGDIERLKKLSGLQKPSFFWWKKLLGTTQYKQWKAVNDQYLQEEAAAVNKKRALEKNSTTIKAALTGNKRKEDEIERRQQELKLVVEKYQQFKSQLSEEYGISNDNLVDENFYFAPIADVHLRTPYASEQINKLRSDIFLKSLELHKYAILANAKMFRNNLKVFFDLLTGRGTVKESIACNFWNTFFFCVPVVSTTLASVSRLFSSIGKDGLGWLLLDEAGQATPQSAVGIIWRAQRCAIVGDPLQIEPVLTIPPNLVYKLNHQYQVEDTWNPISSSVQILADRISQPGTYIRTNNEESIWTGFPLRAHRRCDDPMFRIANQIAYNGQMVKVCIERKEAPYIGPSCWFQVEGRSSGIRHVIEEEVLLLREKIEVLLKNGFDRKKRIYVISPFVAVANECKSRLRGIENVSVGTIHTFQGKEAEVVFLILGSDPNAEGARAWAAQKPNLLNVALTRAQRRVYVIGNKTLWGRQLYFETLARAL